jgi:hypothetical protein
MRALEVVLGALAKKFSVVFDHQTWGQVLPTIESIISNLHRDPVWKILPDIQEQQAFYSQAVLHIRLAKDAWRNRTMHKNITYTETDAEKIFQNVKDFSQKLAERLKE